MAKNLPPRIEEYPPRYCPDCGPEAGYMNILLFMESWLTAMSAGGARGCMTT